MQNTRADLCNENAFSSEGKQIYDSRRHSPFGDAFIMTRCFQIFAFVCLFAAAVFAQIAQPSATPPPQDDDVVKITTSLIQIDVTVTDRSGKIIRDLKPEEIEVYENGKKQKISNFSFISNTREITSAPAGPKTPVSVVPVTPLRTDQVKRTIALVVDDLTLSFESTYYVRRALKKFVDEQMQDGDLVAIIRTGAGIGALQQFTSDRRMLYAAIEKVRWNAAGTGNIGAFAPLQAKIDTGMPEPEPQPGERTAEGVEREFNDFRSSVFASGTLGAVNYVVRGMSELPGRKSIMLLSDGFKLFTKDASGNVDSGRVLESVRRLVDQANRASVVIYTMDPRGLQVTGITAADDTSGRSGEEIQQAASDRNAELQDTQDGLVFLARQTGGFAFINNNDLSAGIRRVLDDQSYYLVAYEPEDETFDPKIRRFNKLDIRVLRKGTRVRYRSGFFGVSDERMVPAKATGNQNILNALMSPFAVNEIQVRMNTLFGNNVAQGSYVRSLLHVTAKDLTFTDGPNETKIAVFDVLAVGFGDNGIAVDQISKTYTVTLDKNRYERFVKQGFVYDFAFPIKKPGGYQLRVALRDTKSEKVGSASQFIEVPNLKKNRLTLSGAALENTTFEVWQKRNVPNAPPAPGDTDPLMDTALRQFKKGTVLNFGLVIFNAKLDAAKMPNLSSQMRLFKDGTPVFQSDPRPVASGQQPDTKAVNFLSSLSLGSSMTPGEYVLEIAITDNLAKGKYKAASQYIQFEVVE
jgi:VWFA-related protein